MRENLSNLLLPPITDAFPLRTFVEVCNGSRTVRLPRDADNHTHLSIYIADSTGAGQWYDLVLIADTANDLRLHKPQGLNLTVRNYEEPDGD